MCYNWDLKFFNQEELKSHTSENHEVGSYICPKCEALLFRAAFK